MESAGNAVVDFGRWVTGFIVIMGIGRWLSVETCIHSFLPFHGLANSIYHAALPVVFRHSELITTQATAMSIVGGLLIYGTIIAFTMFFQEEQEF